MWEYPHADKTWEPASMKALPKRKGNARYHARRTDYLGLNESPPEKEGK